MDTPNGSKSQDRSLTTTSYAVLCILALRDHSMYDLTGQMRRSLHYMWPRAESNVYAEPKRLVEAGLATAREEWTGNRRRTIYSITPAGRDALREWFAAPNSRERYESEALIKVLFGENGSLEDVIAAVRSLRSDAEESIAHFLDIADDYDAQTGDYPDRFALSALAGRLLLEQQAATARWAVWAEETLRQWTEVHAQDAAWGVATMRAVGRPLPLEHDPIAEVLAADGQARQTVEPRGKPSRSAVRVSKATSSSSSK